MTIQIPRTALLVIVSVIVVAAVGAVGVYVGQQLTPQPAAPVTAQTPGIVAQPTGLVTIEAPTDNAPRIEMADFKQKFDAGTLALIVDVRLVDAYAEGHIPGAVSIPEAEIVARVSEIPKEGEVVLYCA
jgi:hypothetical protein